MHDFLTEVFRGENRLLVLAATVAGIGGLLFGYDTGVISGALLFIKQDFSLGAFGSEAVVSSLLIGAVVGAAIAGKLSDDIGRRPTKIVSGCVYALGAVASAVSQNALELVGARFVLGLSVGTASFVSVQYISELVPKRIRGGLTSFNQLMIVTGILAAYIVDWVLKGVTGNWRWMLALGVVPGAALAIGMAFMPSSPRWLVEKGRDDEARDTLRRLGRSDEDVEREMEEMNEVADEGIAGWRELFKPSIRPMIIVGMGLAVFQQAVGVNTVIYYAPTILKFAGGSNNKAIADTVFVGVTNVVFTILAVLLLDKVGRRPLLLIGTSGLGLSLVGLGLYFEVAAIQAAVPWLATVFLVTFVASFAIGLGPVFWLMISEIYPLKARSPAMSLASVTNWAANFAVSATFLTLVGTAGRGVTFWIYAVIAALAVVFFLAKVPETKGKSLEEIEHDLGTAEREPAMGVSG